MSTPEQGDYTLETFLQLIPEVVILSSSPTTMPSWYKRRAATMKAFGYSWGGVSGGVTHGPMLVSAHFPRHRQSPHLRDYFATPPGCRWKHIAIGITVFWQSNFFSLPFSLRTRNLYQFQTFDWFWQSMFILYSTPEQTSATIIWAGALYPPTRSLLQTLCFTLHLCGSV